MQALKAAGVDFVVAPYEADAQMAYLALGGAVHAVCSLCCSHRASLAVIRQPPAALLKSLDVGSVSCPALHTRSKLRALRMLSQSRQQFHQRCRWHAAQVITEDSDLLPYGCPRVLFKMDKAGNGQQVCLEDLPRNRDPSFVGFTHDMFLEVRLACPSHASREFD